MNLRRVPTRFALFSALLAAACALSQPEPKTAPPSRSHALPPIAAPVAQVDNAYALAGMVALPAQKPIEADGLHNVFKLSPNIISGGEPGSDAALAELAAMGVKTIVSVDGKAPNAELAARHGLRYVHIPIEYKGISDDELLQLTKTFRELEGPFYCHCFHGKHRGPAAAEVGRLVLDGITREQALAEMRQWCGTAGDYEGLYRTIATHELPSVAETEAYAFQFPARRVFDGVRSAMIDIPRRHDALKGMAPKDWADDPKHPDVDAANEAVKLAEDFAGAVALADTKGRPADFQEWMAAAAAHSRRFAELVPTAKAGDAAARTESQQVFAALTKTCTECHNVYRNR